MTGIEHIYIHTFRSGNHAWIRFRLPEPGRPSPFEINWQRSPSAADVIEYRKEWKRVILADVSAVDGREHFMVEDTDQTDLCGKRAESTA